MEYSIKEQFLIKIAKEYKHFKEETVETNKEEIYASSYRIDIMINIYEILKELAESLCDGELCILLGNERSLESLYEYWMKTEDDFYEQIQNCIIMALKESKESRFKEGVIL